ncbi:Chitinase A1 [termite gut metagenome]|uniref:Chitinase A1 n=1 Tax=termite gut metagenome TaxID=433724 RepID=A0A5J4SRX5_9ZZZZ
MKALRLILLSVATLLVSITACGQKTEKERVVVAYVTSWSNCIPNSDVITHINYAFGHVNDTFNGVRINNEQRLRTLTDLKKQKPLLKVLLSIGGWGSGRFSEMAGNETNRKAFAADCKRVVDEFGLDGVDLDWEYPTSDMAGISSSPDDTKNFTLLMQDIRSLIGEDKLLTLASSANAKYIDFAAIEPYMDFVNIMTYDIGRPPHHHSALYPSEFTRGLTCQSSVEAHVKAGMPIHKLVLGIPFYGHGTDKIPNFINYKNLVKLEGYTRKWDDAAKVPYLVDSLGKFVCCYDDAESIGIKCQYIDMLGMLGGMYWDYDGDDEQGTLQKAVYEGVMKRR